MAAQDVIPHCSIVEKPSTPRAQLPKVAAFEHKAVHPSTFSGLEGAF